MTQTNETRSDWQLAIEHCANYRKYLDGLSIDANSKTKAYLIDKDSIQRLLAQNSGRLDAIRVYIGHELVNGEAVVRLYMVGCTKDGEQFNDWQIPGEKELLTTQTEMGTTRPCPVQCSTANSLNS
ncbi:MAG TPA: hypothetical protein VLC28_00460 [Flavitalea sp.]|nr:hypothetical protein [Flavitalea sp.]